ADAEGMPISAAARVAPAAPRNHRRVTLVSFMALSPHHTIDPRTQGFHWTKVSVDTTVDTTASHSGRLGRWGCVVGPRGHVGKQHKHQEAVENAPTRRYVHLCASALILAPRSARVSGQEGSPMAGPHNDATVVARGSALSGRVSGQDVDVHG